METGEQLERIVHLNSVVHGRYTHPISWLLHQNKGCHCRTQNRAGGRENHRMPISLLLSQLIIVGHAFYNDQQLV